MTRRPLAVAVAVLLGAAVLLGSGPFSEASASEPAECVKGICNVKATKEPSTQGRPGGGGNSSSSGAGRGGGSNNVAARGPVRSGPSLEEIAFKQLRAYERAVDNYTTAVRKHWGCVGMYPSMASTGAVCGEVPSAPKQLSTLEGQVGLAGTPEPPGAAPVVTITPAQAGVIAVAQLQLPVSAPGIGPDPDVNEWKMAAVGYPLWLWAAGPTHVGPVGQNVGGLSVSLDARVSKTVFLMGDGHSVSCAGGGTPYASWVEPGAKSPTCGYTYQKPSLPSKKYRVTATTYWDVAWTVNGFSGVIQVPRQGTVDLPVGELQAVIVN